MEAQSRRSFFQKERDLVFPLWMVGAAHRRSSLSALASRRQAKVNCYKPTTKDQPLLYGLESAWLKLLFGGRGPFLNCCFVGEGGRVRLAVLRVDHWTKPACFTAIHIPRTCHDITPFLPCYISLSFASDFSEVLILPLGHQLEQSRPDSFVNPILVTNGRGVAIHRVGREPESPRRQCKFSGDQ